jgi:hypothetical protein
MPKLDHQAQELASALSGLINIENTKARLDVQAIIRDGLDAEKQPYDILQAILDWTKS